jgi:hypothetical protein
MTLLPQGVSLQVFSNSKLISKTRREEWEEGMTIGVVVMEATVVESKEDSGEVMEVIITKE